MKWREGVSLAGIYSLGFSQDYWGFFNGGNNSTNIPELEYAGVKYPGANRQAVFNACLPGTLREIKYPTGGRTEFSFESNMIKSPVVYDLNNSYAMNFEVTDYSTSEYTTYYEQTIEINSPNGYIPYMEIGGSGYDLSQLAVNTGNPNLILNYGISLININNPSVDILGALSTYYGDPAGYREFSQHSKLYHLKNIPNGTYVLRGDVAYTADPTIRTIIVEYFSNLNWWATLPPIPTNTYENKAVGGLRITEQRDFTTQNEAPQTTRYNYNTPDGFSSAQMQIYPNTTGYFHVAYNDPGIGYVCRVLKRMSISGYPLIYTRGSSVGYPHVEKIKVASNGDYLGKETFTFTSYDYATDEFTNEYPYTPPVSLDWKRGLPLFTAVKKNIGDNSFTKITEEENQYDEYTGYNTTSIPIGGLKVAFVNNARDDVFEGQETTNPPDLLIIPTLIVKAAPYYISSGVMKLKNSKSYFYQAENLFLQTEKIFQYDPLTLNVKQIDTRNSKNQLVVQSYKYTSDLPGIYHDKALENILTPVIEESLSVDGAVKELWQNNYQILNNDMFLLHGVSLRILDNPIEVRQSFSKYDNSANILEYSKVNGAKEVYLWGYNSQYPVAKVVGSDYATVSQIITQIQIDDAIATVNDNTLRSTLNVLRSINNAFVTTYTYKPLVGITSETDPNGRTIFYEYDAFNRLKLIRDKDGNIIKTFEYHYKQ